MALIGRGMFGGFFGGPPPGGPGRGGLAANAGTYIVKLTVNDQTLTGTVIVRSDPMIAESR
jgi:hypothetical protein